MKRLEFSTHIKDGTIVTIPDNLAGSIPDNSPVRVILMVDDDSNSTPLPMLNDLIAELKSTPSDLSNVQMESGLLAEHLAEVREQPDGDFNVEAWNQTWDKLEHKMDAEAMADENNEFDASLI
ncbi:MAG: hypothetical protein AAF629_25385 [Chloroflexota bacterium]